jgi:hypothetical protein
MLGISSHYTRFQILRRVAGIGRHDGAIYQPRMHDLRTTFAVHRLTGWFKQGADLNRLLPALAAYIGQVGLGSTERYLAMTPERFRRQLLKLSPQPRKKRRWRDDPSLMKLPSRTLKPGSPPVESRMAEPSAHAGDGVKIGQPHAVVEAVGVAVGSDDGRVGDDASDRSGGEVVPRRACACVRV